MIKTKRRIRIYSALEVANICGVVNQTAINWIRNGYLKAFVTPGGQYRVYEEDLSGFLISRGMGNSADALHVNTEDRGDSAKNEQGTVLIIDHDHAANDLLKDRLKSELPGYEILQAYDGFDAGWRLYQQKPKVVFLNTGLPGINIPKLVKKLKKDPVLGYPTVIALVNDASRIPRRAAWAEAFIPQPFDPVETREIVRNLSSRIKITA
ncbi:MAG: helix-turn-helix domain-containing protein [Treponema sp.]|jgi:CheY-like chemotaxis protein|nr:helix-turn-helix domain-containing protein [Treponema sp.]